HTIDGLPASSTQRQRGQAHVLRYRPQRLFGGADHQWQNECRQRQGTCENTHTHLHDDDEEGQTEQAIDYRWHTGQVDYALTDHADPETVLGELVQINGSTD